MNIDIPIIFEDNHLLVVEKPPNVLSQEDRTGDKDMLTLLKKDIKIRYNKPGNVYLGLVHRLDRPTGGVMVFAKTSKAASRLSDQIRRRKFEKQYMAVVHGKFRSSRDTLVHYLLKNRKTNTVSVVKEGTPKAQKAILDYEVIDTAGDFSLVKIDLHTGRPHQIRIQFSEIGHPLYGDQRYNLRKDNVKDQIALWSHQIVCTHPTLREEMVFTSLPTKKEPWTWF
ncbi:MAG TPA: RNA pseudouridine synthase [Oscillospiraceae bacterium]|nr:RNA pseudouridine synthase [Oscillospiraceae bacterium]